jgi:hypothetical protein
MDVVVVIMVVVFVVGLAIMGAQSGAKAKELREAEDAYHSSLAELKASPMDPDLKADTLRKGRVYSNLTRNNKGVTMYDEVALMNDINAACARAGTPQPTREAADKTNGSKSIEDRLSYLRQLREKNLVTELEYDQRRTEILKEL